MSGVAGAVARKGIGGFEGKAAQHGRTRVAVAATSAGGFAGWAFGAWTGAAVPPVDHGRTNPQREAGR